LNVDTNELFLKSNQLEFDDLRRKQGKALKEVPKHLEAEALKCLDGQDYVKLDNSIKSPLMDWAKKKKKKKKKKNKRKIANKSKKANRS